MLTITLVHKILFPFQNAKEQQNGTAAKIPAKDVKASQDEGPPPPIPPHRDLSVDDQHVYAEPFKGGDNHVDEMKTKMETLEEVARKDDQKLKELAAEKSQAEAETARLKAENQALKTGQEKTEAEKWELTAANTDLKNRLQQSMQLTYMQVQ